MTYTVLVTPVGRTTLNCQRTSMAKPHSNSASQLRKPYPDYPLTPRRDGRWQKKIKGRVHYFVGTWQAALEEYKRQLPYLANGASVPSPDTAAGVTLNHLVNADSGFLANKEALVHSGELTNCSFIDYKRTCRRLIDYFGRERTIASIETSEFAGLRNEFAKSMGVIAIGNEINRTRIVFKFAFDEGLIDKPIRYGQSFQRPRQKVLRKNRTGKDKTLHAEQIRAIMDKAPLQIKAMILLGINAGLGNSDCGQLKHEHIRDGWLW